jgi:RNA polymerase sigma factor (sigma-70 family)
MADLPSREEEQTLHRRLVEKDPTAPSDLAVAYYEPLICWLVKTNSRKVSREICVEAAGDAIVGLMKSPQSYKPDRGKSLFAYLQMSAQGDLRNCLQREKKHRASSVSLESVELSHGAGKYLGLDDDPSVSLQIREEVEQVERRVLAPVRHGLTERELQALQLLLQGERRTKAVAQALGIDHLSKVQQEAGVKRFKDKMKIRIKRQGGSHG